MLIAVGGHSRNIGKTSVMCALIRATRERGWQAFKITQHGHGLCSLEGSPCGCAPADPAHLYAIDEQRQPDPTDTGRYLAAGASKAWWIRTPQGQLGHAITPLKALFGGAEHNIVESNSILRFVHPDLYLVVVNFLVRDLKESARSYLDRADAFVVTGGDLSQVWPGVPQRWFAGKPVVYLTDLAQSSARLEALLQLKTP